MASDILQGGGNTIGSSAAAAGAPGARVTTSFNQRVAAAVFALLVAVLGVLLHRNDLSVVDTLDKHVGDWRIALGSPIAKRQRDDIAIVLITEDTLLDYESRSPLDRGLIAEVVRAIDLARPKAIGIDIIFDRRTRQDSKLAAALREASSPIVLGSIDNRVPGIPDESLAIQAEFLATVGRPYGHVMLARKDSLLLASDSVVRYIAPMLSGNGDRQAGATPGGVRSAGSGSATSAAAPGLAPVHAFSDVLAETAGFKSQSTSRIIAWQRPPDDWTPLHSILSIPRHKPEAVKPGLEGIFQPSWREVLKDRIVLIGASMVDRDQLLTPLSVLDRSTMPGVLIHAQALAQRIDGNRDVWSLPDWFVGLVAGFVAYGCLLAARHTGINPQGLLYGLLGVLVIGLASFLAFKYLRVDFPSIALATAWALGGFAGFSSNWAFRRLGIA